MELRQLVTSAQLSRFFTSTDRRSQETLPLLVRKLIASTSTPGTIKVLRMSGGDDVRVHGVDGFVANTVNHPYVPIGDSVWELGTSVNPQTKAQKDFQKRSDDTTTSAKSDTTYVAVTPHVWIDKGKWVEASRRTGVWKDVTVIDGAVLSDWIDQSPSVALWFYAIAGTPIADVDDLDRAWARLVEVPLGRTIPPSLVLGGRTDAAEKLMAWMTSPTYTYRVASDSPDEVELFALAVAKHAAITGTAAAPLLSIRSREAMHFLHELQTPHVVFVRDAELVEDIQVSGVRHLFVICPESAPAPDIEPLPPLDRATIEKELQNIGFATSVASRIAGESKGSAVAMLWAMGSSSIGRSAWLQEPTASMLAPLVLAGSWCDQSKSDRAAIARLAGCSYAQIEQLIAQWRAPAHPLVRWGEKWSWRAWRVAWERLAGRFTDDLLARFRDVAVDVLSAESTSDTFSRHRNWRGRMLGSSEEYSGDLREGLVRSLAMLGSLSSEHSRLDGQQLASEAVRCLLDAESGGNTFLSLSRHLPDLAEAAPDAFLSCVDQLIRDPDLQKRLFEENVGFGGNRYCSLLWALERLAWNPEYLSMVVLLLGRLTARDPGGSLSNRPKNSLRAILLPWYPGTSATVNQRLAAFDLLAQKMPDIAWSCGISLLPRGPDTASPTDRPKFRNWMQDEHPTVMVADHAVYVQRLFDKILSIAGVDHARWMEFLAYIPTLVVYSPKRVEEVVSLLQQMGGGRWTREQRAQFNEAIRQLVHRYGQREDDDKDGSTAVQLLRRIETHFAPDRLEDQHRWLFGDSLQVHFRKGMGYEERRAEVEGERSAAVEQMRANGGIVRLLAWADEVDDPAILGDIVGKQTLSEHDVNQAIDACVADRVEIRPGHKRHAFGDRFVYRYALRHGEEWTNHALSRIFQLHGLMPAAAFAVSVEPSENLWRRLSELSTELSTTYWRHISIWRLSDAVGRQAIPRLLSVTRNYAAIELMSQLLPPQTEPVTVDSDALAACLEILRVIPSHLPDDEPGKSDANWFQHALEQLFKYVERFAIHEETRDLLMRWEWLLFSKFLYGYGRGLRTLHEEMSRSSEFAVNLMKLAYRDDATTMLALRLDGVCDPTTAASQSLSLLHRACTVPGERTVDAKPITDDVDVDDTYPASLAVRGAVDASALQEYVASARTLASASGLLHECDLYLGQVFASAPADPDGTWPCKAVRDEIENLASKTVEYKFVSTVQNKRGTHAVGKTGDRERAIAEVFSKWASASSHSHPRTAAALRQVAEHYVAEGKSRDKEGRLGEFEEW